MDPAIYRALRDRLRAETDAVIQLTTGGSPRLSVEERLNTVLLGPEMYSLNMGLLNFFIRGEQVFFANHRSDIASRPSSTGPRRRPSRRASSSPCGGGDRVGKDPRRHGVIGDMDPVHASTPADLRARLGLLALERDAARRTQLSEDNPYMTDLHDEIAEVEHAYVCSAVAAIAELRANLGGRLRG